MLSRSVFASRSTRSTVILRQLSSEQSKETRTAPRGGPRIDSNSERQTIENELAIHSVQDTAFKVAGMAQRLAAKRLGVSDQVLKGLQPRTKAFAGNKARVNERRTLPKGQENGTSSAHPDSRLKRPTEDAQQSRVRGPESNGNFTRHKMGNPRNPSHNLAGQQTPQSSKYGPSRSNAQSRGQSRRYPKASRSKFSERVEDDPNEDMSRYQVDFPKVNPPKYIESTLSPRQGLYINGLSKRLRAPRVLKLMDHTTYTRISLGLRGGKGTGRKQVPYAFSMLHHNRTANASSKKTTMEAVGHMILKRYRTSRRLTSDR